MQIIVQFNKAIVIGHGSIGKRHADYLKNFVNSIIVVDPKVGQENLFQNKIYYPNPKFLKSTDLLNFKITNKDVVVISNWGPDHYSTVSYVISKGAKKIVLEKPCADSLKELDELRMLAIDSRCKIVVNHHWFHLNLGHRINLLARSLNLGEVVAIWIHGGARCISTAGSHWINLANQIYASNPKRIFAASNSNNINPRGSHLGYYDGVFSFEYDDFKRLAISLTNLSSIAGTFEIYWREAFGVLNGESIKILKTNEQSVSPKITLYNNPTEEIFNDVIPYFNYSEHNQMNSLYNSILEKSNSQLLSDLEEHLNTTKAILYALISSSTGQLIEFDSKVNPKFYDQKFNIS